MQTDSSATRDRNANGVGARVSGGGGRTASRAAFEQQLARTYQQAIAARAGVEARPELVAAANARLAAMTAAITAADDAGDANLPMARLARWLGLSPEHVELTWCVVACSVDGRLVPHLEALGGAHARRGLSLAVYAMLTGSPELGDGSVARLAHWLAAPNPLVETGLLRATEPASPAARTYVASSRMVSFLAGDDHAIEPLRRLTAPADLLHDRRQAAALDQLRDALRGDTRAVVVIEGPLGSGRATAAACARGAGLVVLDLAQLAAAKLAEALVALRRECLLRAELPVLANVDHALGDDAREQRRLIGEFLDHGLGHGLGHGHGPDHGLDRADGPVIVTVTVPGGDLGTMRPQIRIAWSVAEPQVRAAQWTRAVEATGAAVEGDLLELAQRYRVGPAAIQRAVAAVRRHGAHGTVVGDVALAAGLRHDIAEQLGGLAQRIEVTQTWDDLVVADDTADLIAALVGRVRHAHQVLDRWGYRHKIARGAGVAALFSGPPGTGKTMVAGLIALELGLELYRVDLGKVVSRSVGETANNLARLFDGAEAGHALLLFHEADALFGPRAAAPAAAHHRNANLEIDYLIQRVEAFGGIAILTTDLDTAIDGGLKGRLAAHVVFATPDEDERARLWQRQTVTGAAPLAADVSPDELARAFPNMCGANIRNAAISAAFLAATAGASRITQDHLTRAARAEYRGMGHVVPGVVAPRTPPSRRF